MGLVGCLTVLVVIFFDCGESGGHGHHHHSHLRIHLPEFLHHDHHTKVITIHHHHHKPKAHHHHHHHHHHPKPMMPVGHHYHHHHKKMHHVSKDHILTTSPVMHARHGVLVKHRHLKPSEDHFGNHIGHHAIAHKPPVFNYKPPAFDDNLGPFAGPAITSSVSQFNGGLPHVRGVQKTVHQVTAYDALPAPIPASAPGYKVTENGEEDEEDTFTAVNSVHEAFPSTGFGHNFSPNFAQNLELSPQHSQPTDQNQNSFMVFPQLTSVSADGIESYTNKAIHSSLASAPTSYASDTSDPFASNPASGGQSVSTSSDSGSFEGSDNDPINSYSGEMISTNYLRDDTGNEEFPVSFHI